MVLGGNCGVNIVVTVTVVLINGSTGKCSTGHWISMSKEDHNFVFKVTFQVDHNSLRVQGEDSDTLDVQRGGEGSH